MAGLEIQKVFTWTGVRWS